jgi:outer membrane biosynthesis protein TonB
MTSPKALLLPLFVSVGLHATFGWTLARHWGAADPRHADSVQISYPESPSLPAPKAVQAPAAPKKKLRGIPVPRYTSEPPAAPTPAKKDRPKSSAEMMADPQKGRIFISYFSEVKKKIQKTLVDRFSRRYSGKGSVTLGFVLSSQGFVEKVAVLPKGTEGDEGLQDLAIQCLRESAPFGVFPPGLGSDRIAFNVTIFFDGR